MKKKAVSKTRGKSGRAPKASGAAGAALEPVNRRNYKIEAVIIAVVVIAAGAAVYKTIDYFTGWGDPEKSVKRELIRAEKNAINKKYGEAAEIYRNIIRRYGKTEKLQEDVRHARLNLAKANKDAENHLEAIALYEELIAEYAQNNNDMHAWLLLELGESHKAIMSFDGAIEAYNTVIKKFPESDWAAEALFGIADTYKEKKDMKNAEKYYDEIIKKYKKGFLSAEAMTNKAILREQDGKIDEAVKIYRVIVAEYPDIVTEYAKSRLDALSGGKTSASDAR
ncbi:MAG TPA: tetratricopeptide repeat protein [bacterium]|nr:tetratricopeptide repeat protein [bacterium]